MMLAFFAHILIMNISYTIFTLISSVFLIILQKNIAHFIKIYFYACFYAHFS